MVGIPETIVTVSLNEKEKDFSVKMAAIVKEINAPLDNPPLQIHQTRQIPILVLLPAIDTKTAAAADAIKNKPPNPKV